MRLFLISLFFVSSMAFISAGNFRVISVEKLDLPRNEAYGVTELSSEGNRLALTTSSQPGLVVYSRDKRNLERVARNSVMAHKVVFSPDERMVFFTEVFYEKRGKQTVLKFHDLDSGIHGKVEDRLVYPPEKMMPWPQNLLNWMQVSSILREVDPDALCDGYFSRPYAVSDGSAVYVKDNSGDLKLTPLGEDHYLWASLSPSGERVVAVSGREGLFVCNRKGKDLQILGELEAPQWLDNHWIIGMVTRDDGHFITGSVLRLIKVDQGSVLDPDLPPEKLMNPSVAEKANMFACHSQEGEVFLVRFQWETPKN